MGQDNPMDIRIVVKRNLLGIVIIVRAIQEVVEMNLSQRIPYTGTGLNEHGEQGIKNGEMEIPKILDSHNKGIFVLFFSCAINFEVNCTIKHVIMRFWILQIFSQHFFCNDSFQHRIPQLFSCFNKFRVKFKQAKNLTYPYSGNTKFSGKGGLILDLTCFNHSFILFR